MRLLYIIWGEEIVDNGIFANQVQNQLKKIKEINPSNEIMIVSGIPVLSKSFLFNHHSYLGKLTKINDELNQSGIIFKYLFLFTFSRWFVSRAFQTITFRLWSVFSLWLICLKYKPDIIHCRSYHPSAIVTFFKRIGLIRSVKFIFDPRSLFPEEGILLQRYSFNSIHYRLWKLTEKKILTEATCIIGVSDTLIEHYKQIEPKARYELIYTSADTTFLNSTKEEKLLSRKEIGIHEGIKSLVYTGELSDKGWYSIESLVNLYKAFKLVFGETCLLIVSKSNNLSGTLLLSFGLTADEIFLIKGNTKEDVKRALAASDYAANAYKEVKDSTEEIISKTVIASKTGEYLAMGLPILVNSKVGAASEFVQKFNVGISYVINEENKIRNELLKIDSDYEHYSNKCRDLSSTYFSSFVNAKKYSNLYDDLISNHNINKS